MAIVLTDGLLQYRKQTSASIISFQLHFILSDLFYYITTFISKAFISRHFTAFISCHFTLTSHTLANPGKVHQVLLQTKRPGDFPLGPGHHTSRWPATCNVYPPSALPASSPGEPSRSSPPSLPEALPSSSAHLLSFQIHLECRCYSHQPAPSLLISYVVRPGCSHKGHRISYHDLRRVSHNHLQNKGNVLCVTFLQSHAKTTTFGLGQNIFLSLSGVCQCQELSNEPKFVTI